MDTSIPWHNQYMHRLTFATPSLPALQLGSSLGCGHQIYTKRASGKLVAHRLLKLRFQQDNTLQDCMLGSCWPASSSSSLIVSECPRHRRSPLQRAALLGSNDLQGSCWYMTSPLGLILRHRSTPLCSQSGHLLILRQHSSSRSLVGSVLWQRFLLGRSCPSCKS